MDYTKEIIKELKKKGAKGDINANSKFENMGIDSLDLMDMIIDLEKKAKITVPDDDLMNLKTVKDLQKEIEKLVDKNAK